MLQLPIYFDNQATTRVDPSVLEAMLPYFGERYGNAASSNHVFGWQAAEAVETAREHVANLLSASAKSLVFTSGATEANNLALKGVLRMSPPGSHLVVNAAEHRAVLDPARKLQRQGYEVTVLPVDAEGRVDPQQVVDALRPQTKLVSVMFANNEVGTINPIREIGAACRRRNVWFHCDAAQAVGKISIDLQTLPIDLLSFSGHKLYGPKGIGGLYVRRDGPRILIDAQMDGGGHEGRLRSGTLPVPLIVGLGAACRQAAELLVEENSRLLRFRQRLWDGLSGRLSGVTLNGPAQDRLAGNLNVSFDGVDGEALMMNLRDIAVSSGSACTSADPEPSHVLLAMGVSERLAKSSLRFGIGRFNTEAEINFAIGYVAETVKRLRQLSTP